MIREFLRNDRGVISTEILIVIVAVAAVSIAVVSKLIPSFVGLHETVKTSITDVNETGF